MILTQLLPPYRHFRACSANYELGNISIFVHVTNRPALNSTSTTEKIC